MATRTATALHAARDRYARAHTCLKDAQYEHAMASKQLTIATEASVQAQKMQALNHNDTSCLFLSLLGTDLLQRCLAAPCGPRTCWGGRQGLTCKELGRLRLVATTFNAGLIEGTAELALSHLSNIEREWMSWRSTGEWMRTLSELERMIRPPRFERSGGDRSIDPFSLEISDILNPGNNRRATLNKCILFGAGSSCATSTPATFVCGQRPLRAGLHSVEFTVSGGRVDDIIVGVGSKEHGYIKQDCHDLNFAGICISDGWFKHATDAYCMWNGQQSMSDGDVLALVLDFRFETDCACLTVYKNGVRLGVVAAIDSKHDMYWSVRFGPTADSNTQCAIADWQPPAQTPAGQEADFHCAIKRLNDYREDVAAEQQREQDPRENREQAITWMGTLSSAVQAATVTIHAMPEQFGESIEDVHGQIDIAQAGDSDFLGSSFPQILQQVLDLKVCLEDVTGWFNNWV